VQPGTQVRWSLHNLSGQSVADGQFEAQGLEVQFLDFTALPSGVYVFELQAGQEHFTERVVLK